MFVCSCFGTLFCFCAQRSNDVRQSLVNYRNRSGAGPAHASTEPLWFAMTIGGGWACGCNGWWLLVDVVVIKLACCRCCNSC
jgi:hypothetical protein